MNFYRPPTKLQGGKVFSCVCRHSLHGGVPLYRVLHPTILGPTQFTSPTIQAPLLLVISAGQDWRTVQTCSVEVAHWC